MSYMVVMLESDGVVKMSELHECGYEIGLTSRGKSQLRAQIFNFCLEEACMFEV